MSTTFSHGPTSVRHSPHSCDPTFFPRGRRILSTPLRLPVPLHTLCSGRRKWNGSAGRDGRALQRIAALLFALAAVADRAGTMPLPARLLLLVILRHAERVAWAFAANVPLVRAACRQDCHRGRLILPGVPDAGRTRPGRSRPPGLQSAAARAHRGIGASGARLSAPDPSPLGGVVGDGHHLRSWRGPAAFPAPDTS
jgi:hypothetical protein